MTVSRTHSLAALAVAFVFAESANGSLTRPGPPIELSDIEHSVHSELGPSDRTNVGISENASFWVDSQDIDEVFVGEAWVEDWDYVEVTWSSSGGTVTLYPLVGEYTDAYFDLCANNESVTLKALAQNGSDPVAADPPVQKQKVMQKKVPTAINVTGHADNPIQGAVENANGAFMGGLTHFACQITPTDIDFSNLGFQKVAAKGQSWTFPDGTIEEIEADTVQAFNVVVQQVQTGEGVMLQPNLFAETVDRRATPKTRLTRADGSEADFSYDVNVSYHFDTGHAGATRWKEILVGKHTREFRKADYKARMILELFTTINGQWRGPWAAAP